MSEFKMLLRLKDMFGESLTLNQAIEIVNRTVFTMEILEEEGHIVDSEILLEDLAICYIDELEYATV